MSVKKWDRPVWYHVGGWILHMLLVAVSANTRHVVPFSTVLMVVVVVPLVVAGAVLLRPGSIVVLI